MTVQTVALAALIEDMSIYPRHAVDGTYVGQLVEAISAGATLPPPLIEKGTMRIVDGWHRVRAARRVLGADGSLRVDVRRFDSPPDVVRAAVEANMTHGRKLDHVDRVRCAMLLGEAGFTRQTVALTLRMREEALPKLVLRVASAPAGSPDVVPGTTKLPLKRAAAHMAGTTLTARQAQAHATLPGTSLSLLARQLVSAVRNDFIDIRNERLLEALRELHTVLGEFLAARKG